jgi:hypothetical protein
MEEGSVEAGGHAAAWTASSRRSLTKRSKLPNPEEAEGTTAPDNQGFQFINQTEGKIKDPAIKKLVRQNAISRKDSRVS